MHDYLITFYIGKFDKNTDNQELSNDYFISTITRELGSCTIIRTKGFYTIQDTKKQQREPSLKVEKILIDKDYNSVFKDAMTLSIKFKKLFNQGSILFTIQKLETAILV